jgi:hypothetical protein
LLYLVDRRLLLETGSSGTGAGYIWGPAGPCLNLGPDAFAPYFAIDGSDLTSRKAFHFLSEPGDGELSDYDVTIARSVAKTAGTSRKALRQALDALPEGQADLESQAPYEAVLRAAGVTEETIRAYQALNASMRFMDSTRFIR